MDYEEGGGQSSLPPEEKGRVQGHGSLSPLWKGRAVENDRGQDSPPLSGVDKKQGSLSSSLWKSNAGGKALSHSLLLSRERNKGEHNSLLVPLEEEAKG